MFKEARDVLEKGKDALQDHAHEVAGAASKRGKELATQVRDQSLSLFALAARHGAELLEDWAEVAAKSLQKKRRRSSPVKLLVGAAAVAAVGYVLLASSRGATRAESPATI